MHARMVRIGAALLLAGTAPCLVALAAAGDVVTVTIADYKYAPPQVQVSPGTTVRWLNGEKRTSHSILFLGPDGFESDRIFPGESWQRTFDKPGSYAYRCGPHPDMKGLVEVVE